MAGSLGRRMNDRQLFNCLPHRSACWFIGFVPDAADPDVTHANLNRDEAIVGRGPRCSLCRKGGPVWGLSPIPRSILSVRGANAPGHVGQKSGSDHLGHLRGLAGRVGFKISSRLLKEAGEHLGYPRSDAGDRSRKPEELRAAAEQHIVTASGKAIVGADDKAGGAVIMATAPGPRQFRRRLRGAGGGRRPPG